LIDDETDETEEAAGPEELEEAAGVSLDGLLSGGFDWVELVRAYPIPALLLAAVGGFVLGRSRGQEVVETLGEFAASQVSRHVNEALGEDLL
jgi:hypothetical protein